MEYALSIKCTESNHQDTSIHYLSLEILTIFFGILRLLQTRYPSGDKEIVDCAGIIDGKSYTLYTEQNKDSAELLLCKLNNVILIL